MCESFRISTKDFSRELIAKNETVYSIANGYLGLRGDYEEKAGCYHKGTYINGFYDTEPIVYGETAYGYARNHETILNLPDPKIISLFVNDREINLLQSENDSRIMELDFRTGIMSRSFEFIDNDFKVTVTAKRLVSFKHLTCGEIKYTVTAENRTKDKMLSVKLFSSIDTSASNLSAKEDPRVGAKFSSRPIEIKRTVVSSEKRLLSFLCETRNSGLALSGTAVHVLDTENNFSVRHSISDDIPELCWTFSEAEKISFSLEKFFSYNFGPKEDSPALEKYSEKCAVEFCASGWKKNSSEQEAYLSEFWNTASVEIKGCPEDEKAVHFNLFHLLQSSCKNGKSSVAAKGLTGEGYEGHFFWDSEAYVCPVFTYLKPDVAESLLKYRSSILGHARKRASELGLKGALYPWRTISGNETSAYFPAGTAQYHIDADIVYAMTRYSNAVRKEIPLSAEVAAETARMWMSLGAFIPEKNGMFCINTVTGPDEYTACVDNNAYTNLMARENLLAAIRLAKKEGTASSEEISMWQKAADLMYIPFDKKSGIYPQDDSFMSKNDWDFAATPKENYPLLLHYHPLEIYRRRVLKQPDLVLAQILLSGRFSREERIRNFLFYEKYTTGDSSLSHCIQSIAACDCGDISKAEFYFDKTARMDLEDKHGNTRDGLHIAAMAGSWMALIFGFAGFKDYNGQWAFDPKLSKRWKSLRFSLLLEGSLLDVNCTEDSVTYTVRKSSGSLTFRHRNKTITLRENESCTETIAPKLGAVLFDLDGVLTDTARLHFKAWKETAEKHGLDFNEQMNVHLSGRSRMDSLEFILEKNSVRWPEEKKLSVADEKNSLYKKFLESLSEKDILPGMKELLQELSENNVQCVLASASLNAVVILERLGIKNYFDKIVDPSSLQKGKPEPDIYIKAAELSGCWYTDCVGIEDAASGVNAIRQAGIKAVGIGPSAGKADLNLASTKDVSFGVLADLLSKK